MERVIAILLLYEKFIATMAQKCNIKWTNSIETAGIKILSKGILELSINPDYFYSLPEEKRVGLIWHEIYHVLMKHLEEYKNLEDKEAANISMDESVNQYIPYRFLPDFAILPELFNHEKFKSYKYYYNLHKKTKNYKNIIEKNKELSKDLKTNNEDNNSNLNENSKKTLDNHECWNESELSNEEQKTILKNIISQTIDETIRLYGKQSIPNNIESLINKIIEKPKVNWINVIRNFYGRSFLNDTSYSKRRPNKKFEFLTQGKVRKLGPNTIIGIDWSGSILDKDLLLFTNELKGIVKEFSDSVKVVFFDTKIFEETFYLNSNFKTLPKRSLRGGTNFQCLIDYANIERPDLLIIFTDGEAQTPKKPHYPVLWALVGGIDNPSLFGKRVLIDFSNNKKSNKILEN